MPWKASGCGLPRRRDSRDRHGGSLICAPGQLQPRLCSAHRAEKLLLLQTGRGRGAAVSSPSSLEIRPGFALAEEAAWPRVTSTPSQTTLGAPWVNLPARCVQAKQSNKDIKLPGLSWWQVWSRGALSELLREIREQSKHVKVQQRWHLQGQPHFLALKSANSDNSSSRLRASCCPFCPHGSLMAARLCQRQLGSGPEQPGLVQG